MKFSRARGIVALVVFLSVIVGLVVHAGTGTPSALGWRDIAVICPVGALEVLAGAKAFLVHPIALLVAALLIAFLVGKAFCAWVCPVPHIRDFFRWRKGSDGENNVAGDEITVGASFRSPAAAQPPNNAPIGINESISEVSPVAEAPASLAPVGGERDGVCVDSRHFVLVGAIASSFAFGFPVFCLACPVGLSFAVVIGLWNLFQFNEASWGLLVFPALILLEVVFFRKWCTKFCPISALLSLVASHSKTLRPIVQKHTCLRDKGVDCTACVSVCPERVDPHSASIPECSRCGECVEKCPAKAIDFTMIAKEFEEDKVIEETAR